MPLNRIAFMRPAHGIYHILLFMQHAVGWDYEDGLIQIKHILHSQKLHIFINLTKKMKTFMHS